MRGLGARSAVLCVLVGAAIASSGCQELGIRYTSVQTGSNLTACGASGCHPERVASLAEGVHESIACTGCHRGTGEAHAKDPKNAIATTDWTIDGCATCHGPEASTYLYDDNAQVGPFGGSIRVPPQPKVKTFPAYNTIIAGHPFTKDYNEEGAHAFMLQDHAATLRGKYETCLQCKSTKLDFAWVNGRPLRVTQDATITLTHTAAPGVPAKQVHIPEGTMLTYATDPVTSQVDAKATMPDGTVYTSHPSPSEDATRSNNMIWASTMAAIAETLPYGAGCNHCHDPHSAEPRLVRQAMIRSIEGSGGPLATGGVNPYASNIVKAFSQASAKDRRDLVCSQCHVEYVCGKSPIDKVDRDAFGWAKAKDLHDEYMKRFDYKQDWKHAIIKQPMVKNQHPETELFWNSAHYEAGVSCMDCHMPQVRIGSTVFRSHWFTSPYKYRDAKRWGDFAAANGLDATYASNPCVRCHADRTDRAIAQQKEFYASQARVEALLARSVASLGALASTAATTTPAYAEALDAHRRAHVLWENIAVSENSMGFHNFEEAMTSMADAEQLATTAIAKAKEAAR